MLKNIFIGSCFIIINLFLINCNQMKITKQDVINITNKKSFEIGYNINEKEIIVSKHKKPWNRYIPKWDNDNYSLEIKRKLEKRNYWAVYYRLIQKENEIIGGGDACFFVDGNTGEIITFFLGE